VIVNGLLQQRRRRPEDFYLDERTPGLFCTWHWYQVYRGCLLLPGECSSGTTRKTRPMDSEGSFGTGFFGHVKLQVLVRHIWRVAPYHTIYQLANSRSPAPLPLFCCSTGLVLFAVSTMASQKSNDDNIDNLPDDASSYGRDGGSGGGSGSLLGRAMTGTSSRLSDHDHHLHHHDDSSYDIAKEETQLVIKQRLLVGSLLFVAGAGISLLQYMTMSRSQQKEFRAVFQGGADKILSTFNDIVRQKVSEAISL
jgi:hypothetical protein